MKKMNHEKLTGAIGLACRAGALAVGQQAAEDALKRGKARLLILDPSASDASRTQWEAAAANAGLPVLILPAEGLLGEATGRGNARAACVTDPNFIKLIRRNAETEQDSIRG